MSAASASKDRIVCRLSDSRAKLGISRRTVYRRAAEGRLTLKKDGGCTIIVIDDAGAYFDALPTVTPRNP